MNRFIALGVLFVVAVVVLIVLASCAQRRDDLYLGVQQVYRNNP